VLTRDALSIENVPGNFGTVYPVLKSLEEAGRIRRGYFVAGLGATQFALPGALDLLRALRQPGEDVEVAVMAATDPANPYGAAIPWNQKDGQSQAEEATAAKAGRGPTRTVGATVVLVDGALAAYLARGDRQLLTYLPDAEPERSTVGRAMAIALIERARSGGDAPRGMLIEDIDGVPAPEHPVAAFLKRAGFIAGAMGMQATYVSRQSSVISRQSSVVSRQSSGTSDTADARRPSRSAVSSPFSRRVFERDE